MNSAVARVLLLATLANGAVWAQQSDAQPAETMLVLQMGACERQCPVYRIALFSDGSGIFEGRHYVRRLGLTRLRITREALGGLVTAAAMVFDMPARFVPGETSATSGACESPRTDGPTAILTVSAANRARTVVHFRGCGGADATKLKEFEDRLVAVSGATALVR